MGRVCRLDSENGHEIVERMFVSLLQMEILASCDSLDMERSETSLEADRTRILRDVWLLLEEFKGSTDGAKSGRMTR